MSFSTPSSGLARINRRHSHHVNSVKRVMKSSPSQKQKGRGLEDATVDAVSEGNHEPFPTLFKAPHPAFLRPPILSPPSAPRILGPRRPVSKSFAGFCKACTPHRPLGGAGRGVRRG